MIWRVVAVLALVLALALAVPAVRHLSEVPPALPPTLVARFAVPDGVRSGSGSESLDAAISPDERQVAFVATRDGQTALWLESLDTGETRPLDGTTGAALPAWKQDGTAIAFFMGGKLNVLTLATGATTEIADAPAPGGAAWLADGSLLFAADAAGVIRRFANGSMSNATMLAPGDEGHSFPSVDEAGRTIYIARRSNGARVVRLVTAGESHDLIETTGHAQLHSGILVYVRDNVLLAQRLDEAGTRLVGRGTALGTDTGRSANGRGYFTSSKRMLLWAPAAIALTQLVWFDRMGQRTETATEPGDYWQARLSPNGRAAAVTLLDPLLRTLDVAVVPLDAPGQARRVSLSIGPDTDPVWSPDGATLAFRTGSLGAGTIVTRPAAQSERPEAPLLAIDNAEVALSDWRREGLLFSQLARGGRRIVMVRRDGEQAGRELTQSGFSAWDARWSSDGRWIAHTSDESGQAEIYIQAWPAGTPRVRATFGGGRRPEWSADGTLYFMRDSTLMRTRPQLGSNPIVPTPQPLFAADGLRDYDVAPGSGRILAIVNGPRAALSIPRIIFDWASAVPPPPAERRPML